MKYPISLALLFISVSASAHLKTAPLSLFDFTVYAKDSIYAECSDYQGRTGAGGSVFLRDFVIVLPAGETGCPLESNGVVSTVNGAVLTGVQSSCIATRTYQPKNTNFSYQARTTAPFVSLSDQMDALSATLLAPIPNTSVTQMTLNVNHARALGTIALSGSATTLFVVNILDADVSIYNIGVTLSGGLTPQNIIWNFPNANTVFIAYSGMLNYGMPGTFVAPQAKVTFNNARITGALFAKSILGKADHADCSGVVSGQVNGSCLSDLVPGIGCASDCGTGGQQHQHP